MIMTVVRQRTWPKHWPKALKQWETIAKDGGGWSERKNIEATVGELDEQRFSIQ